MMDSILFWNAVALEANRVSHSDPDKREQNGPTLSSRALAIVHLAMYDAYAGVEDNAMTFPRYLSAPASPPPGTSHQDAVAGAAFIAQDKPGAALRWIEDLFVAVFANSDDPASDPSILTRRLAALTLGWPISASQASPRTVSLSRAPTLVALGDSRRASGRPMARATRALGTSAAATIRRYGLPDLGGAQTTLYEQQLIRALAPHGTEPVRRHDLSAVRFFASTGPPRGCAPNRCHFPKYAV